MKYYKFNRDRSMDALQKRVKSSRKLSYLASRDRIRILDSFHFDSQTWGALHKAWKGYVIAKSKNEPDKLVYYAGVIQKLERELGIKVIDFPDLNLELFEDNDVTQIPEKEITEEEQLQMLFEQDRQLLDKYREEGYQDEE
jgi:hypothetical protein